ncbi:MAG TPA: DUF1553 domain-containing protein, partial [Puia sp.]|nr:DUF1553 domain-containing protein [Puia sp.]
PLQALIMLNDPTVLEAARVLAERLSLEQTAAQDKIVKAFRLIVCRKPADRELKTLVDYYNEQLQQFASRKLDAHRTLDEGEYRHEKQIDESSAAALMKVVTILYNLEETITKT